MQVNSHQADGMMALYNITGQQPAFPLNGTVRTYYIQAVGSQNTESISNLLSRACNALSLR